MRIGQAGMVAVLVWALVGCSAKEEAAAPAPAEAEKIVASEQAKAVAEEARAKEKKAAASGDAARRGEAAKPGRGPASAAEGVAGEGQPGAEPPPAPDGEATLTERMDAYLAELRRASYAFNVPSPIKVAKPVTVHFWLDPRVSSQQLAADLASALRATQPGDTVESGVVKVSSKMRATLKGDDFTITPVTEEVQPISAVERTHWAWEVTPKRPGHKLPLYLSLDIVLPQELAGRGVIAPPLDKRIDVEVTWWWLLDTYWEKYWQWLLGGLGTAFASVVAWWWKRRQGAA